MMGSREAPRRAVPSNDQLFIRVTESNIVQFKRDPNIYMDFLDYSLKDTVKIFE